MAEQLLFALIGSVGVIALFASFGVLGKTAERIVFYGFWVIMGLVVLGCLVYFFYTLPGLMIGITVGVVIAGVTRLFYQRQKVRDFS